KFEWRNRVEATYDGGDAYRDGKPSGGSSLGKIAWLAKRRRLLIAHNNYWELEPGRGWSERGAVPAYSMFGALLEDAKTGNVFHCYTTDPSTIHEWDPQAGQVAGKYQVALNPRWRYQFGWQSTPCLVGRDIFALSPRTLSAFAFN